MTQLEYEAALAVLTILHERNRITDERYYNALQRLQNR